MVKTQTAAVIKATTANEITIDVPMAAGPPIGYVQRHVDVQLSTAEQANSMWRLLRGLDEAGARLKNDRRVSTPSDAVRWLMEALAGE